MKCPKCGEECTRDMVDVGVGEIPSGPWGCEDCQWVDESERAYLARSYDDAVDSGTAGGDSVTLRRDR
jgi:hypothetical protein